MTNPLQNKNIPQPAIELRESTDSYEISVTMPPEVEINQPEYAVEGKTLSVFYQAAASESQPLENYVLDVELPEPVNVIESTGEWAPTWLVIELPKIQIAQPTRLGPQKAMRNSQLGNPPTSSYPLFTGAVNCNFSPLAGDSGIDNFPKPPKE